MPTCPSTNTELVRRARAGEAKAPYLLVADQQTAGLGRDGRSWETPPRGALTMSALVDPKVDALGLFPLFAALAVCDALRAAGFSQARVKWPNDILLPADTPVSGFGNWRKVGGILAQAVPGAGVVVGIGVNISQTPDQLPVPTATSLALNGPIPDSGALRMDIARELANVLAELERDGAAPLLRRYEQLCATIGQRVEVAADHGDGHVQLTGRATGIADDGAVIITNDDGAAHQVHAGDVQLMAA